VLLTFGGLLLLLFGWLVVERLVGKAGLTKYERVLRAKGERLTVAELILVAPEGENGAPDVVRLCGTLQNGKIIPIESPPPQMRMIAPGKAMRGASRSEWLTIDKEKVFTNRWEAVEADLQMNEQTLKELRAALKKPVLYKRLNYEAGFKHLEFVHLMRLKRGGQWLSASGVNQLHHGNGGGALEDIEALTALLRMQESEELAIDQLVRFAIQYFAVAFTWEALESDSLDDPELERMQTAWSRLNFIDPVIHALRMERAMGRPCFDEARYSVKELAEAHSLQGAAVVVDALTGSSRVPTARDRVAVVDAIARFIEKDVPEVARKGVLYPVWQFAWSDQDQRQSWSIFQTLIDAAETAKEQHAALPLEEVQEELDSLCEPGGLNRLRFLLSPMSGTARDLPKRSFQAQTQAEMAVCAIALKRYQLKHGKYPDTLSGLVPEFLARHPIDYMDGGKLRYRVEGEDFTLWSVGVDGRDDGGNPGTVEADGKPRQMWRAPDAVWPRPASDDEIREYEKRKFGK